MQRTAERYHDFSYGHKVTNHESRCQYLHGHNGRVYFVVAANELDDVGRVLDFGEIGRRLCNWIENTWDHHFLVWDQDPQREALSLIDSTVVWVPFNPTAENLAEYLVRTVGPTQLLGTGCILIEVRFEETRKCMAKFSLDNWSNKDLPKEEMKSQFSHSPNLKFNEMKG